MSGSEPSGWDARLVAAAGSPAGGTAQAFIDRLPPGYRELTAPDEAAADMELIGSLEHLGATGPARPSSLMGRRHVVVVRPSANPDITFRLRRFGEEGIELSSTLPLLESFGLVVVEAVPLHIAAAGDGSPALHLDDIGLRAESPYGPEALRFVPSLHGDRLVDAIEAAAGGETDVDSLNRLVIGAGLEWRQVMVLRAYLRYWRQTGVTLAWEELADPLVEYPDLVRSVVAYFAARFDPASEPPEPPEVPVRPGARGGRERAMCVAELELVARLEQDRVLRGLIGLVDATLRTNYYQGAGRAGRPLVLKLSGPAVPEIAHPIPDYETFVHGPEVEGIHLRAGPIARGGLRWSDRPGDFRTEVLDLAFAQVKKNAIIVPTGAKGGFVCRPSRPAPSKHDPVRGSNSSTGSAGRGAGPGAAPDVVRKAYETFVGGLLDVTDNLRGGVAVTPEGVLAADGPDPYLVVAADKGTATFSDLANSVSEQRGFWLGDAFASGGSRGYDHKAMGITARGAWVAVRRHFRELGVDVGTQAVRVVGVGDMSGDVFGNGMLQSRTTRLVAAFDHRHIFIDPDPDPGRSYRERSRLAALERSSWADYDPSLISPGGGVWPRDAKSVPVSAEAAAAIGIVPGDLTPPRLVSAILAAPVDLLFFGGIGTFVKASDESDADVGDHANDAVRITSDEIRARVVAEGANLGVTQRARIRYSRRGGRINADFIDNAAGVATSDREVNLKILLSVAIERGRLSASERDGYLLGAESEVAEEVLRQVDHSVAALNRAALTSDRYLDAYEALVDDLERAGMVDRRVEELPERAEFARRRAGGAGLIRPELATILAYAKKDVVGAFLDSGLAADPAFTDSVVPYFPAAIRRDFADLIPDHRLFRELAATDVAGELIDRMGVVWAHDLAAELGRSLGEVAGAFWVARRMTGAGELWAELETLVANPSNALSAPTEAFLHASVAAAVADLTRQLLVGHRPFHPGPAGDAAGRLLEAFQRQQAARRAAGGDGPGTADGGPGTDPGPVRPDPGFAERGPDAGLGEDLPDEVARRFEEPRRRVRQIEAARVAGPDGDAVVARQLLDRLDQECGLQELATVVGEALEASPPPRRVQVWQARALLDDLAGWRAKVAEQLLSSGAEADPVGAVGQWQLRHRDELDRAAGLRGGDHGGDRLALVALILRRLGQALDPQA